MSEKLDLMTDFPRLSPPAQFEITSDKSAKYNCIAWAAGETHRKWWPDKMRVDYWPPGVPRETTLTAFIATFQKLGYEPSDHADLESGFEKIAIFAKPAGTPAHAARQLPNGKWTSKLGRLQDIEHSLTDVECTTYGQVKQFMKRRVRSE